MSGRREGTDPPPSEHPDVDPVVEPKFPDRSRLELDRSLTELVHQAEQVMTAQSRLLSLLRAGHSVVGDLDLSTVLRRIVDAARELVEARYAALGVIGPGGHLKQFVHAGMPPDLVDAIGQLPECKGLLGALTEDPHPIRVARLGEDDRATGFPAGHPVMKSFLGVPILVRGEVFGNLYLTDAAAGQFSEEDEELVASLAATAGVAIDNAHLFGQAVHRQQWLRASTDITRQVLSETGEDPLHLLVHSARSLASADTVLVALLTQDRATLVVEAAAGADADDLTARTVPVAGSVLGETIRTGEPMLATELTDLDHYTDGRVQLLPPGPAMVAALIGNDRPRGVLAFARHRGRAPFEPADLDMADSLANHATLALELADARADRQRLLLAHDRDRIARDLHDHIIQRLFAAGLDMESMASGLDGSPYQARLLARVDDVDDTIRQLRDSIFELRGPLGPHTLNLSSRLHHLTTSLEPILGFPAHLSYAGPPDIEIPDNLATDIEAVAREALTDIARHAHATCATVTMTLAANRLRLEIHDNGTGLGHPARSSDLTNMRHRAEDHGGTFTIISPDTGGTHLDWTVPLPRR